jgi:hypothetical protein
VLTSSLLLSDPSAAEILSGSAIIGVRVISGGTA